jgi:hypothetical protein
MAYTDDQTVLDLSELNSGCRALTRAAGQALSEAAAVCLENQGHAIKVTIRVNGEYTLTILLVRSDVDERMRRCYNDLQEATEAGACAVAILLMRKLGDFTIVERSAKGLGVDYWLGGDSRTETLPFKKVARMEVSGILSGSDSDIRARIAQKIRQVEHVVDKLPAYVVVVEHSRPEVWVTKYESDAN